MSGENNNAENFQRTESLYDKFINAVHYPYNNNDFYKGFSDRSLHEMKKLSDLSDEDTKERIAGWTFYGGVQQPINKLPEYTRSASRFLIGMIPYWQYYGNGDEPRQEGNKPYNAGSKASPLVGAYGVKKIFQDSPALGATVLSLPFLAGIANPNYNTATVFKDAIDNRLKEGYD